MHPIRRYVTRIYRRYLVAPLRAVHDETCRLYAIFGYSDVGAWGEQRAARYLWGAGLLVVRRNWRYKALEGDIIGIEGRTLVLVEVKTRHTRFEESYPGRGAITAQKQEHLRKVMRAFIRNNGPLLRRLGISLHRVDTVEVYYAPGFLRRFTQRRIIWERNTVPLPCFVA